MTHRLKKGKFWKNMKDLFHQLYLTSKRKKARQQPLSISSRLTIFLLLFNLNLLFWSLPAYPFQSTDRLARIEELARELGYTGGRLTQAERNPTALARNAAVLGIKGDVHFRVALSRQGYTFKDAIDDRETGMQAMVVQEKKGTGQTYIVFRGTEPFTEINDIRADLDDEGHDTGRMQYVENRYTLDDWANKYPGAIIAGHSLGGALAQHYAVDHPGAVKEAYLFNAPGISERGVLRFIKAENRPPVNLFVGSGGDGSSPGGADLVSELGGPNHLPSRIIEVTKPGAGIWKRHSFYMLNGTHSDLIFKELRCQEYQERRIASYQAARERYERLLRTAGISGAGAEWVTRGTFPYGPTIVIADRFFHPFGTGRGIRSDVDKRKIPASSSADKEGRISKTRAGTTPVEEPQGFAELAENVLDEIPDGEERILLFAYQLSSGAAEDCSEPAVLDSGHVVIIVRSPDGAETILEGEEAITVLRRKGFLETDTLELTSKGRRGYDNAREVEGLTMLMDDTETKAATGEETGYWVLQITVRTITFKGGLLVTHHFRVLEDLNEEQARENAEKARVDTISQIKKKARESIMDPDMSNEVTTKIVAGPSKKRYDSVKKANELKKQFPTQKENSYWSVCLEVHYWSDYENQIKKRRLFDYVTGYTRDMAQILLEEKRKQYRERFSQNMDKVSVSARIVGGPFRTRSEAEKGIVQSR